VFEEHFSLKMLLRENEKIVSEVFASFGLQIAEQIETGKPFLRFEDD
jgi:hypothetical protein